MPGVALLALRQAIFEIIREGFFILVFTVRRGLMLHTPSNKIFTRRAVSFS
jgi:hypothetical protein